MGSEVLANRGSGAYSLAVDKGLPATAFPTSCLAVESFDPVVNPFSPSVSGGSGKTKLRKVEVTGAGGNMIPKVSAE